MRVTVSLAKDVVKEIESAVGPRGRNKFITEAVVRQVEELRRERLVKALEEGYKAEARESRDMAAEFEAVDLEGWDEY
jgi:metal-responsive CopG/Arc/MetJ family transcriptional regulator